jgi:hypothetical protein
MAFSAISLDKAVAEAINSMLKYDPDHRPLASQIMKNLEVPISCQNSLLGFWAYTISMASTSCRITLAGSGQIIVGGDPRQI